MKKFMTLLVKEIRELLTKQLVVSLVLMMAMFYFIGNITRSEAKRAAGKQKISVYDLDRSALSGQLIGGLETLNFQVTRVQAADTAAAVSDAKNSETNVLIVIPQGFGDAVSRSASMNIETYTFLRNFSVMGARTSGLLRAVVSAINNVLSDKVLKEKIPGTDPESLKNPIKTKDFIVIKSRMAEGSAALIAGFVSSQSMLIPVILMMIIIYSSQMVISAIAMEKQNKTLETLLTVPISRASIVAAKMLAAGLAGLLSAAIYMLGFRNYMSGLTGDIASAPGVSQVVQKLGLALNAKALVLLGVSLFFAILCALAMATILGVLAEDFRSAQSLIMPMVFLVMIPYFITLFTDVKSLTLPVKILILAIPFSHPFLATQNIFLENYGAVWFGILYMAVLFTILVIIAARIFSSDKVLTMKLRWGKKKKTVF
jgi:ABC-2 type transport system permease protein